MKIAIAGCGIAGTATGTLLARQGHAVTIFEQADQCGPVGAGILIQPIGQSVLKSLSISDVIESQSARLRGIEARKASGKRLIQLEYQRLRQDLYGLGVHRGLLFSTLLNLAQDSGVEIREGACLTGYQSQSTGITLKFDSPQETDEYEYLIATDGARSRLRTASGIPAVGGEYEYGALWATGGCTAVQDQLWQFVEGTQKLAGLLPIGNQQCSFFWGLTAAEFQAFQERGLENWKETVLKLCPEAAEIVNAIHSFDELTFTTYRNVSMRSCWADRILFLGDAAHPSSPHLGQGANLALEDAWLFTECLGQVNDFKAACEAFESMRRRKIRFYQRLTHWLTPFFQSDSAIKGWGRDIALPVMSQTPIFREQMLKTLCGFKTGWLRSKMD